MHVQIGRIVVGVYPARAGMNPGAIATWRSPIGSAPPGEPGERRSDRTTKNGKKRGGKRK